MVPAERTVGYLTQVAGPKARVDRTDHAQKAQPIAELSPSSLFFAATGGRLS